MALTLEQHFKSPKLDTIVFHGGWRNPNIQTNLNVCRFDLGADERRPPAEIARLVQLETVIFEFCPNLDLAETFTILAALPKLTKLQLKSCNISEIPAEIGFLDQIRILNLGNEGYLNNNEFMTFPPEIGQLENLQELDLHDNLSFRRFPPEVSGLSRLQKINLRGFLAVPENIELVPDLQELRLVHSHLVPAQIEPLIDRPNGLRSVTVSEAYCAGFRQLCDKYSSLSVGCEDSGYGRGSY